jgi:thiol-disulfide isomerase/thioredoxin
MATEQRNVIQQYWKSMVISLFACSCLLGLSAFSTGKGDTEDALIFLTASWCGSCRELSNVTRAAHQDLSQYGLSFLELDVDQEQTQKTAATMGINVSGVQIPQIYFYRHGRILNVYDGKQFHYGDSAKVRALIKSRVESALSD